MTAPDRLRSRRNPYDRDVSEVRQEIADLRLRASLACRTVAEQREWETEAQARHDAAHTARVAAAAPAGYGVAAHTGWDSDGRRVYRHDDPAKDWS